MPHRAILLTVAAMLVLAGCSLLTPPPKRTQAGHLPPRPRPSAIPAPPATSGSAAAAGRLQHPQPSAAPPAAAAPGSGPIRVVGLSQDAVRGLLGPPTAQFTQGPAQTWTYEGAGCRVEISFYYDVTRNGFFALSQRRPEGGDGSDCLARIHDAHLS